MALETLIVKTQDDSFHTMTLNKIVAQYAALDWYVISTSAERRKVLRKKYGRKRVLNPFRPMGEFRADLIWIEDWPCIMGENFEELQYQIFSCSQVLILTQSFEAPSWIMEKLKRLSPNHKYIIHEKCAWIPLWPNILRFKKFSRQLMNRRFHIYESREIDFHVTLDIRFDSYFLAYSCHYPVIAMNCSGLRVKDYRFILTTIKRFLVNQLRLEWNSLIDYHYDNQDRGNSHSKDSLSRSPHYWDIIASKWKEDIRLILWWSRWREKA